MWEAGKLLRVSVQLLETSSGRFLWAHRTEIPADNLGEFQDEVVREIRRPDRAGAEPRPSSRSSGNAVLLI